jgi:uncharacterized phage protein (TIGR01671 family)
MDRGNQRMKYEQEEIEKRVFKFRAWRRDTEEMYYGDNNSGVFEFGKLGFIGVNHTNGDWTGASTLILMQYTGLKDRYGKEIYEGDIVKTCRRVGRGYRENEVGIVHYSDIIAKYHPYDLTTTERCEVIGNLYENPELIQNKND